MKMRDYSSHQKVTYYTIIVRRFASIENRKGIDGYSIMLLHKWQISRKQRPPLEVLYFRNYRITTFHLASSQTPVPSPTSSAFSPLETMTSPFTVSPFTWTPRDDTCNSSTSSRAGRNC
eukprot:Tbor_TRINITY_DN6213_c2_g1::TRINITY_DN6213_c2_g1_i1::g.1896::m.1896